MSDASQSSAGIHDELGRLDCREISISNQPGFHQALVTRGGQSFYLQLDLVRNALVTLKSSLGDTAVWNSLQKLV